MKFSEYKTKRKTYYVSYDGIFPGYVDPRGYSKFYDTLDEQGLPVWGLKQVGDHLLELAAARPDTEFYIVEETTEFRKIATVGTDEQINVVDWKMNPAI